MLKTSGCAFSISSSRTTEYGERLTRSVSWPPSSYPTYPGGEPMSLETECFSMNSDISKRISDFSLPKRNSASARATSVLPTPVGPRKRNEPAGRLGDLRPARERRMARASAEIAFSWLMTRLCSSSSMRRIFCTSSSLMAVIWTPVQRATTYSISSLVTRPVEVSSRLYFFAQLPEIFALFAFLIRIKARLFELVVGDGVLHAVHDELDALLNIGDLGGQGGLAKFDARAGFV